MNVIWQDIISFNLQNRNIYVLFPHKYKPIANTYLTIWDGACLVKVDCRDSNTLSQEIPRGLWNQESISVHSSPPRSLPWASNPSLRFILILFSHLRLDLPSALHFRILNHNFYIINITIFNLLRGLTPRTHRSVTVSRCSNYWQEWPVNTEARNRKRIFP
jgi:hypothetical protein